ncbi:hypothetical protein OROHE_008159 [Orobanche hederae]
MSRTDDFLILDSQNAATTTEAKNPQSVVRRKLADISNLPQNRRPVIPENKSQSVETTIKEYTDKLQKENMALVKMLAQRNKIIEQRGTELDILRVNMHKMHEQNRQLALSNYQMLVELNSAKDRLKVLQHELGCKIGLLNTRKLELEEKERTMPCENADTKAGYNRLRAKLITSPMEGESLKELQVDEKSQKPKGNSQPKTADPSEQVLSKETTKNKRTSVRRQSARLKAAELRPANEILFETDDTKVHDHLLPDDAVPEHGSISTMEIPFSEKEKSCNVEYESQEFGRPSLIRPSRLAAKKILSYKEIPLTVKMRRSE